MCSANDNQDANLDRNLRMIGQHLELPEAPTGGLGDQRPYPFGPVPVSTIHRGVRFMKNHRFAALAGAGSAVAATVTICAVLFVPTPHTTVEAATIFASFREAVGNAFELRFENLGDQGVRVDGRVVVVFDSSDGRSAPFESRAKGVFVEAHARADETADKDVAGLDVDVAIALVPRGEWAYLELRGLPAEIQADQPAVALFIQQMTQGGLLLDLDGIMDKEELADLYDGLSIIGQATEEGLSIGAQATGQQSAQADAKSEEAEFERLAGRILTGRATAEEFESLVQLVEQAATNVAVTETEPGLHVLTAHGFDFEGDQDAERILGSTTLQVAYRVGVGLEWAALEHLGQYDGTIRFQMTDLSTDDELFSRDRYLQDGKTRQFDLGSLIETLGLLDE